MQARNFLWVLLALSAGMMKSSAQDAPAPAPVGDVATAEELDVVATLEMAQALGPFQVRLMVENRGKANVKLLRLRPGWLEYNGGSLHDWQVQIEGPGGAYQFPFHLGEVPPLEEKDFIDLAPGEGFSTIIHTEMAALPTRPKDAYKVGERGGTYSITVSRGAIRSNTLKFSIGEPQ